MCVCMYELAFGYTVRDEEVMYVRRHDSEDKQKGVGYHRMPPPWLAYSAIFCLRSSAVVAGVSENPKKIRTRD